MRVLYKSAGRAIIIQDQTNVSPDPVSIGRYVL